MQRVGVGAGRDVPHDRREREPDGRRDARRGAATPSRRLTSTVRPAADGDQQRRQEVHQERRRRRAARGRVEASQPSTRRPGTRSGASSRAAARTVWASPVSQAPTPGRSVAPVDDEQRRHRSRAPPVAVGRSGGPTGPAPLPAKQLAPDDAPQVDRRTGDHERDGDRRAAGRRALAAPSATSGSRNGMKSSEKR